jgi:hypothetical protein
MKTSLHFSHGFLAAVCLAGFPHFLAAADYDQAEITKVHREVQVMKANAAPRNASEGQQIKPVTSVATGAASRAELRFPDRTLTRLGANSRFTLRGGSRTLDLDRGVMMVQVPKRQGGAQIRTAGVTAAVTGTTVLIEYHPGGVVKLIVIEGECVLTLNRDRSEFQTLRAGQMITMQDGAGAIPAPQDIDLGRLLESSRLISANDSTQPNQQAKFPHFQDEFLRDLQPEVWVPKAFKGKPYNIFETGGTTGMPKQRIGWNDYKVDYSEFSEKPLRRPFPPRRRLADDGPHRPAPTAPRHRAPGQCPRRPATSSTSTRAG